MKTGSINLASKRMIPVEGYHDANGPRETIQLLCNDLSATTTFYLDFSLDKTNWDTAVEAGTDVSDTLVSGVTKVFSFEADAGLSWRLRMDGSTTGTVNYIIL